MLLTVAYTQAGWLTNLAEDQRHDDAIVHAETSRYQRIVMTQSGRRFSLFLNGNLQFSSIDEYRYHEALVHPLLSRLPRIRRVLVLGGGDGLAVREVLRYEEVEEVVLVDLDPAITDLAAENLLLRQLNENALHSPRLQVINADAFTWLAEEERASSTRPSSTSPTPRASRSASSTRATFLSDAETTSRSGRRGGDPSARRPCSPDAPSGASRRPWRRRASR